MIPIERRSEADRTLREQTRQRYFATEDGGYSNERMVTALRGKVHEIKTWAADVNNRKGPGEVTYKKVAAQAVYQTEKAERLASKLETAGSDAATKSVYSNHKWCRALEKYDTDTDLLTLMPDCTYEGNPAVIGRDIMMHLDRNFQELQDRVVEHETGIDPRSVPGETEVSEMKPEKRKLFGLSI